MLVRNNLVNTAPSLRDLYRYVTPSYATEWKQIGIELGLSAVKLKEIRVENIKVKDCCNEMLEEWLCVDTKASWKRLFNAIESPAVTCKPESGNDKCN